MLISRQTTGEKNRKVAAFLRVTLFPWFIHFKSCNWKNHPSFVNSGPLIESPGGGVFFWEGSGWEAGFNLILKQRLQSLVSHRLAALVFGFNLISTELLLPAGLSIEVTKQKQHRAETGGQLRC